jgi:hypothetical protein
MFCSMALPIKIEKLINGKTFETEIIEFKTGWKPKKIYTQFVLLLMIL